MSDNAEVLGRLLIEWRAVSEGLRFALVRRDVARNDVAAALSRPGAAAVLRGAADVIERAEAEIISGELECSRLSGLLLQLGIDAEKLPNAQAKEG